MPWQLTEIGCTKITQNYLKKKLKYKNKANSKVVINTVIVCK